MKLTTADIGLALRDHLEGKQVLPEHSCMGQTFNDMDGAEVEFVDVSDAHNPVIHLSNGQKFTVRIIAS